MLWIAHTQDLSGRGHRKISLINPIAAEAAERSVKGGKEFGFSMDAAERSVKAGKEFDVVSLAKCAHGTESATLRLCGRKF